MKKIPIILALAGVGLAAGLVVWLGAGKIVGAVLSIGWWGFGIIVAWQLALYVVLAAAWRAVCPNASLWSVIWGRLVREGGSNILPFSEFGGLAFGARALTLAGVRWSLATASSIADVSAEFIGELPFLLFGIAILVTRGEGSSFILPLAIGVLLLVFAVGALIWAEKHSTRLFHGVGRRIAARWLHKAAKRADEVQHEFEALLAQPRRIALAVVIHLAGWIGGGVTVWITYRLLGGKINLTDSIALEALLSGALAVAFLVPGGLGVQEASYVALGRLFGMPAQLSLGVSLLRRARNIVIGTPSLLSWQLVELRGLVPANRGDEPPASPGRGDAKQKTAEMNVSPGPRRSA